MFDQTAQVFDLTGVARVAVDDAREADIDSPRFN